MRLVIQKTMNLHGNVSTPSSKSHSIRGLFFALLAAGESTLQNILSSDDVSDALNVSRQLGALINEENNHLKITSGGPPFTTISDVIDTGNSGITTRFILPLLGLRENAHQPILLNCGEQMRARPIKSLVKALIKLGMHIRYLEHEDQLPIEVSGHLRGGCADIDGLTSQYLSALLIALPCASSDSEIRVTNLHERPYVEMTLSWLKKQGIIFAHEHVDNLDIFYIRGKQRYTKFSTTIAGDFSSASCLITASALTEGSVVLQGLDMEDPQGDKRLINILQEMGAKIVVEADRLCIHGGEQLIGINIDANDIPDLVPALAVMGTYAKGKTEIRNVRQARIKETDRIHSMTEGLKRMGAKIKEHDDGITVYQSHLHGALINGYGDHRTVMAFTVAGLLAEGETTINEAEVINKTFPQFVQIMQSIHAHITIEESREESRASQHIIFIGFKHVGKTCIGKKLAQTLKKDFIDLDQKVEDSFEISHQKKLTCRQIMELYGLHFFRELETEVLKTILSAKSSVISLGGGTVLSETNQQLIHPHKLIHVLAQRGVVFEQIMVGGRPAFFDPNEDPYDSFTRLWNERMTVYKRLTPLFIENHGSIEGAVKQALTHLTLS